MSNIVHLRPTANSKEFIVNGQPFLMRAAELQNSSLTSAEYMDTCWENLAAMHINTILGACTWEDIEPEEGKFTFSELDKVILGARKHGIRLVLLWFGSFKNGVSTYTPAWVKADPKRFPRALLRKIGDELEVSDALTLFSPESVKADARAFGRLMQHLKEFDSKEQTVIMIQVENETGLLYDTRDRSAMAERVFNSPVPDHLIDFLKNDWDHLHPELTKFLETKEKLVKGRTWVETFGKGPRTDELFQAYHLSRYVDEVAAAGKKVYPIPLYTNVWLNYVSEDADNDFPTLVGGGGYPGDYPSGGPVPNVLDIWQHNAPHLDTIACDLYLNDYASTCRNYRHRNQPLFIPEQRRDEYGARRIWVAYGSYQAWGVSPFGIDTLDAASCPFTRQYALLESVEAHVLDAQRRPGSSAGFYFDPLREDGTDPNQPIKLRLAGSDYELTIERAFVFGKPGPACGMVIHKGDNKFLCIGWGFKVIGKSLSPTSIYTSVLTCEEKYVVNKKTGELKTLRKLGGDETQSGKFANMPNEDPDYGDFPICVTIPSRTMICEVSFYHIDAADIQ